MANLENQYYEAAASIVLRAGMGVLQYVANKRVEQTEKKRKLAIEAEERSNKRRELWQQSWMAKRDVHEPSNTMTDLYAELVMCAGEKFVAAVRMPRAIYEELYEKVTPLIERQATVMRKPISVNTRLQMTLKFLAFGEQPASLHLQARTGQSTAGEIIRETCEAIYLVLKDDYLQAPCTRQAWEDIAGEFETRWNLPHCIGAVDGKHVRLTKPPNSGSLYHNYKGRFSFILMGVVGPKYEFLFAEVGAEGKASDSGVWKTTSMYKDINHPKNPLNIPPAKPLPGMAHPLPYFFVGDNAFALSRNLMKPYPVANLPKPRVYNYRICRGRRIVENAFGILSTRWRVLRNELELDPENGQSVVLATIALHNMLCRKNGRLYVLNDVDQEVDNNIVPGRWRRDGEELDGLDPLRAMNVRQSATKMREDLADYFVSDEGEVSWQYASAGVI